jgi:CRP-like cAMP-binding protein
MDSRISNQMGTVTEIKKRLPVDQGAFLSGNAQGTRVLEYGPYRAIFNQGEPADSVYYLRQGMVKLAVASSDGREAIVAILGPGGFLGEGCLTGEKARREEAMALTDCTLTRVEKSVMTRALREQPDVLESFLDHLISRNIRYEQDLIDQLLNTSEKRLARTLLLLSQTVKNRDAEAVLPTLNQETLAQMVGTTRSRVSHFMNKFKKLGLIDYNSVGGVRVNHALANMV